MTALHVCGLHDLDAVLQSHNIERVMTLTGPGKPSPSAFEKAGHCSRLELVFHDIGELREGLIPPAETHVRDIIAFVDGWDQKSDMLIHCWMGVSRSTAAALVAMLRLAPHAAEAELAKMLRKRAPFATPNPLIIAHADKLLGRNGALIDAVESIGRGEDAFHGDAFSVRLAELTT